MAKHSKGVLVTFTSQSGGGGHYPWNNAALAVYMFMHKRTLNWHFRIALHRVSLTRKRACNLHRKVESISATFYASPFIISHVQNSYETNVMYHNALLFQMVQLWSFRADRMKSKDGMPRVTHRQFEHLLVHRLRCLLSRLSRYPFATRDEKTSAHLKMVRFCPFLPIG